MICFNCKRQIPDNVPNCPNCGAPITPVSQVGKEIKVRRWQRWVFYGIFIVLFLATLGFALWVYNDNTAYLKQLTALGANLSKANADLASAQSGLTDAQSQAVAANQKSAQLQAALDAKTTELQTAASLKDEALQNYQDVKAVLSLIDASTFSSIVKLGFNISNADLARIPVADFNLDVGTDSNGDGLSDTVSASFGIDPNKADPKTKGYSYKQNILDGYDALTGKKMPIDQKYAATLKGRIMIQVQGHNEAWYISTINNKRYFLGRPADALAALQGLTKMATSTASVSQ